MRARAAVVMALAIAMSSCGPTQRVHVGMKEIDTQVLIGPGEAAKRPVPRTEPIPAPGFPGIVEPPLPQPPPPEPHDVACPNADPLSPIARAATPSADVPPVPATYHFRNSGSFEIGDAKGGYPRTSQRTVTNIVRDDGARSYSFDVAIPGGGGMTTTTTYHVYPDQPNAATQPGIYIDRIATTLPGRTPMTFAPIPPLELVQFPASANTTWSARGVDPFSHLTMSFDGRIARTDVVDACGVRLEAWLVDITNGSLSGPLDGTDITFAMQLDVAPQYGGLVIADKLDWHGTDRGTPIKLANNATITREPVVKR